MHALHGLHVVRENLRSRFDYDLQIIEVALEIADKCFNGQVGAGIVNPVNRFGPDSGSAVGQVITINRGDDNMRQAGSGQCIGYPPGFIKVHLSRSSCLDVAEPTGSRAGITEDHDGCRASAPAFTDIRAGGLLANRVEAVGLDQVPCSCELIATRSLCPDPGRFPLLPE